MDAVSFPGNIFPENCYVAVDRPRCPMRINMSNCGPYLGGTSKVLWRHPENSNRHSSCHGPHQLTWLHVHYQDCLSQPQLLPSQAVQIDQSPGHIGGDKDLLSKRNVRNILQEVVKTSQQHLHDQDREVGRMLDSSKQILRNW